MARNFLRFGARRVLARLHAVRANGHLDGIDVDSVDACWPAVPSDCRR